MIVVLFEEGAGSSSSAVELLNQVRRTAAVAACEQGLRQSVLRAIAGKNFFDTLLDNSRGLRTIRLVHSELALHREEQSIRTATRCEFAVASRSPVTLSSCHFEWFLDP